MGGLLVFFHCESNAGYAITHLERVFLQMGRRLVNDDRRIHFAYPSLRGGRPVILPPGFSNVLEFDSTSSDRYALASIEDYVRRNRIVTAFGFDQSPRQPGYRALRRGGVLTFVSYWGAPMSSPNVGLRLLLKRLNVASARNGPDHYIFESEAMRELAVSGRGIPRKRTGVCHLGVDTNEFSPATQRDFYAHREFDIPTSRDIIYYSGHMEPRKGVGVLLRAANHLVSEMGMKDVHFLILGNRPGEEEQYAPLYVGTPVQEHVTFGGYRSDVSKLLKSSAIGTIASTGWDSFTMSSLEMAATGLPLVVSRLQGLAETVEEGVTGYTFPVGDYVSLAQRLGTLLRDRTERTRLSQAARARVLNRFTTVHQLDNLVAEYRRVLNASGAASDLESRLDRALRESRGRNLIRADDAT